MRARPTIKHRDAFLIQSASSTSSLAPEGFELCACGYYPLFEVAPQCNRQPPGERHDADAPRAFARASEALVKPLAQITVRLIAQPTPREFHHQPSRAFVASFANALLDPAITAGIGRGCKPQAACHFAPITHMPPAKQFFHQ